MQSSKKVSSPVFVWKGLNFYFSSDLLPEEQHQSTSSSRSKHSSSKHSPKHLPSQIASPHSKSHSKLTIDANPLPLNARPSQAQFDRWAQGIIGLGGKLGDNLRRDRRNHVCIFREFSGEEFETYRREKRFIVGLPYFESLLQHSLPFPECRKDPIYTRLLDTKLICATGLSPGERELVCDCVQLMAGSFSNVLNSRVSHLVASAPCLANDPLHVTAKYAAARGFRIPIVTPQWLEDSWKAQKILSTNSYAVPPFVHIRVACADTFEQDRQPLQRVLEQHGAIFTSAIDDQTSHLLAVIAAGPACAQAKLKGIHIVTPDWVHKSLEQGYRADESCFPPQEVPLSTAHLSLNLSSTTSNLIKDNALTKLHTSPLSGFKPPPPSNSQFPPSSSTSLLTSSSSLSSSNALNFTSPPHVSSSIVTLPSMLNSHPSISSSSSSSTSSSTSLVTSDQQSHDPNASTHDGMDITLKNNLPQDSSVISASSASSSELPSPLFHNIVLLLWGFASYELTTVIAFLEPGTEYYDASHLMSDKLYEIRESTKQVYVVSPINPPELPLEFSEFTHVTTFWLQWCQQYRTIFPLSASVVFCPAVQIPKWMSSRYIWISDAFPPKQKNLIIYTFRAMGATICPNLSDVKCSQVMLKDLTLESDTFDRARRLGLEVVTEAWLPEVTGIQMLSLAPALSQKENPILSTPTSKIAPFKESVSTLVAALIPDNYIDALQSNPDAHNILSEKVICLSPHLGSSANTYRRIVFALGGSLSWNVHSREVTHYVAAAQEPLSELTKRRDVKIVSLLWLEDMAKRQTYLPENQYHASYNPRMRLGFEISISPSHRKPQSKLTPSPILSPPPFLASPFTQSPSFPASSSSFSSSSSSGTMSTTLQSHTPSTRSTHTLSPVQPPDFNAPELSSATNLPLKVDHTALTEDPSPLQLPPDAPPPLDQNDNPECLTNSPLASDALKKLRKSLESCKKSHFLRSNPSPQSKVSTKPPTSFVQSFPSFSSLQLDASNGLITKSVSPQRSDSRSNSESEDSLNHLRSSSFLLLADDLNTTGGSNEESELPTSQSISYVDPVQKTILFAEKVFIFSGFDGNRLSHLQQIVTRLGGRVQEDNNFHLEITHVVVAQNILSVKISNCIATGKWVLKESYLLNSQKLGHFDDEEFHEWDKSDCSRVGSGKYWRKILQSRAERYPELSGKQLLSTIGPFSTFTIFLYSPDPQKAFYRDVFISGGGKIVASSPPFDKAGHTITHVFVDLHAIALDDPFLQAFLADNLPCFDTEYIIHFLIDHPGSPSKTFSVPNPKKRERPEHMQEIQDPSKTKWRL